ncbi:MAG: hypothetical protein H6753_03745 [Candidatus Omnitrophica bacterium]|nr:hypothetical protein [Candidatus Omnitrophota bacterium]
MKNTIYSNVILPNIPRILSQINTNIGSSTFGCCERYHWHNSVTAAPNARFQEAVLTLALFYKQGPVEYKDNPLLLSLVNAIIGFWIKIQEPDGSFNEWYVHEGSYVATAFSSYAISETVLLLGKEQVTNVEHVLAALVKASSWLGQHSQKAVCNQQSGALLAIHNTYMLTAEDALKVIAQDYEQLIASCQTTEGWFLEYGGPDIGYLSLTIDYLAKYYHKTKSDLIARVIDKALGFIANFIHQDGTVGGAYTSRETEFFIPHGVELLAASNENAAFIAGVIRRNLAGGKSITPSSLDDRYLMYNGYTFLQAGLDGLEDLPEVIMKRPRFMHYPLAGIAIWRWDQFEFIANLNKVGTFVAFVGDKKICDSGILIEGQPNLFSGYLQKHVKILHMNEQGFEVQGHFCLLRENSMSPLKQIFLNGVQLIIGRLGALQVFVKEYLRKKLITGHKYSTVTLKRAVVLTDEGIEIDDRIEGLKTFERIVVGARLSYIYVPSSRLFQRENLKEHGPEFINMDQLHNDAVVVNRQFYK